MSDFLKTLEQVRKEGKDKSLKELKKRAQTVKSGDNMNSKTMRWVIYDLLLDLGHIKPIAYGLEDLNGCLVERAKQW